MRCIAESGSTKTIWVFLDNIGQEKSRLESIGLNPFFVEAPEVEDVFRTVIEDAGASQLESIDFYGSGCSSPSRNARISTGLSSAVKCGEIRVHHDLLAAARATCQFSPGIVAILGTGSNSCAYDGTEITDNVPAMGFMVGDEGSGTAIGRRLIQAWMYREMTASLKEAFETELNLTKEKVLDALYYQTKPNRFLASLAKFCANHRDEPMIKSLLAENFDEFVVRHLKKYDGVERLPIHFVGSIAHHYQDFLADSLSRHSLQLGSIIQSPIDALLKYHNSLGTR